MDNSPILMHAVDASKHHNKSSRCVLCENPSCVFFIWCSQIGSSKLSDDFLAKIVHSILACRLSHTEIVILHIRSKAICRTPQRSRAFMNWGKPRKFGVVFFCCANSHHTL
jgi:hypothetical protein